MSARKLLSDVDRQSELVEQLIALLDDEKLVEEAAHYGQSQEWPVLQRYRAIDEYRAKLKRKLWGES